MALRFDDKVALVTGGGAGLGRVYCLALAARGAKVVVNDMNAESANAVVKEIQAAGGKAAADTHSVVDGDKVIATCMEKFGGIHIIVNNAGILRDVSFAKQTPEQWDIVLKVHLYGARNVVKAAWKTMCDQKYGRIINITSINGLYGAFGQSNYSSAKSGATGFTKTLAMEGAKKNIKVNCVAPGAGTAMTATVMPKAIVDAWKPELVAPLVCFLAHEECPTSGEIFESGGGWIGQVKYQRTQGHYFDIDKDFSLDDVKAAWDKVTDWTDSDFPEDPKYKNPMNNKQLVQILKKQKAKL